MYFDKENLYLLTQCAIAAACKAGIHISRQVDRKLNVITKPAGDTLASQVVTEVDTESEQIVLETLSDTMKIFDIGLLTEERPDDGSRLFKAAFWCIDPLDGTLPFIHKTHGYSVSIALVAQDGTPLIGVIYDPVKHNLYHATKEMGAFRNQDKLNIALPEVNHKHLYLFADRGYKELPNYQNIISKIKIAISGSQYSQIEVNAIAGGAINTCLVLENAPSFYYKFPKRSNGGGSLWDYAAAACIFNEAGGVTTDIYGDKLELNRVESTYLNHKGVLFASDEKTATIIREVYQQLIAETGDNP